MKKVLFILFCFFSIASFAQNSPGNDTAKYIWYKYQYGSRMPRYQADSVLNIPKDTTYSKTGISRKGNVIYVGNGLFWTAVQGSSSGSGIDSCTSAPTGFYTWKNGSPTLIETPNNVYTFVLNYDSTYQLIYKNGVLDDSVSLGVKSLYPEPGSGITLRQDGDSVFIGGSGSTDTALIKSLISDSTKLFGKPGGDVIATENRRFNVNQNDFEISGVNVFSDTQYIKFDKTAGIEIGGGYLGGGTTKLTIGQSVSYLASTDGVNSGDVTVNSGAVNLNSSAKVITATVDSLNLPQNMLYVDAANRIWKAAVPSGGGSDTLKLNISDTAAMLAPYQTAINAITRQSILGYKNYTVTLTQSGSSAPTATILDDMVTGVTLARTSAGVYTLIKTGAWTAGKTMPLNDIFIDEPGNIYRLEWISVDVMRLSTYSYLDTTVPADGVLSNRLITIQIYN